MTRLLVCSHSGVVDVNRAIYRSLAKLADVEITLIVPNTWKGNLVRDLQYEFRAEDRGLRILPLPVWFSGKGSLFFYRADLRKALGSWRPDAIFVDEEPWSLCAFQIFAAFPRIRKIFYTKENLRRRLPFPFRVIEKWIFSQSEYACSVASEVTEVLKDWKGYPKEVKYLPHSIDPISFHVRTPGERLEIKRKYGVPQDAFVVGYFGRLTEEKGIQDFLDAISVFSKQPDNSNVHFLFVGSGSMSSMVERSLSELPVPMGKVIPAVRHDSVAEALALLDVLVLPSRTTPRWKEQFGRVVIEALACGASVIGSDSGEIPHLIRKTKGGLVFHEGDSKSLLSCIRRLVENPQESRTFAEAGRAAVSAEFTHEAVARRLADILGVSFKAGS